MAAISNLATESDEKAGFILAHQGKYFIVFSVFT
jgi:hypothetical protein